MSQDNVKAVRRLYDAFNRGDLEAFEKGTSRDLFWKEADNSLYSAGNPYRSFAAVRDGILAPTARDFDDFRVDLDELYDAGEFVIGTGRYRGRCKATGKELATQFCHVLHVDQYGKLDRMQEYADTFDEAVVTGRIEPAEKIAIREPMPA